MRKFSIGDFRFAIGEAWILGGSGSFFRGNSNRGQFRNFLEKRAKFGWGKQLSFLNHFNPKSAFVRLLLDNTHLGNKIRFAPGTAGCPVICADTGSCTPELPPKNVCGHALGQSLYDIQAAVRKSLGSPLQFLLIHRGNLHSTPKTCRTKKTTANRKSPIENRQSTAFTILELLVSVAVLAIILVMLLQVVNGLLQSTRTQSQQMDSVASARRALDVMAADLQNAVIGESSTILVPTAAGSNFFALLAARRGPCGSDSPRFLAIGYSTNANNQIVRSYGSVDFSQTDLLAAATNTTNTPVEPLARGILAAQVLAITEAANFPLPTNSSANWSTNTYNGLAVPANWQALITRSPVFASTLTNRTRALEIWIAAVDDQNFQLLTNSSKLSVAQGLLASAPSTWRSNLDKSAIPNPAKSAIRILNKTIALP